MAFERSSKSMLSFAHRSSRNTRGCGSQWRSASTKSEAPASTSASTDGSAPSSLTPDPNAQLPNESSSFSSHTITGPSEDQISSFDPVAKANLRRRQLPPSRYSFRSPKYDRGPLHPYQPPPPSDPVSRVFVPGPFSLPRLSQTYHSTLAADLMTLAYNHEPPGTPKPPRQERLRSWDDSSPYFKNRPLRGPRGKAVLPLLKKPITPRTIPTLDKIVVHSLVKSATENSAYLHVAGMVVQAITGKRAEVYMARKSNAAGSRAPFNQREGRPISVGTALQGEAMWHFLSNLTSVVLPRIKEFRGLKGTGDRNGSMSLGLNPDGIGGFPEIEVNYESYPAHMLPGVDITFNTTATNDRDARILLSSLGLPFQGSNRY